METKFGLKKPHTDRKNAKYLRLISKFHQITLILKNDRRTKRVFRAVLIPGIMIMNIVVRRYNKPSFSLGGKCQKVSYDFFAPLAFLRTNGVDK